MEKNTAIKGIEFLISENKLEEALRDLLAIFENINDYESKNDSINLLGRLAYFHKNLNNGLIENFDVEISQVRHSIIRLKEIARRRKEVEYQNATGKIETTTFSYSKTDSNSNLVYIFQDDFSTNKNEWKEGHHDEVGSGLCKYYFSNNVYHIEQIRRKDSSNYSLKFVYINLHKEFEIECKIYIVNAFEDKSSFSLVWGSDSLRQYSYLFSINHKGEYKVEKIFEKSINILQDWNKSDSINPGLSKNIMTIQYSNGRTVLIINGYIIFETDYLPLFGSFIGFMITSKIHVAIDSFSVKN